MPNVHKNSLAVCELCDATCEEIFDQMGVQIDYNGLTDFQGWQDPLRKLWHVPISNKTFTLTSSEPVSQAHIPYTT